MKQRITYLLRNPDEQGGVDPATLDVGKDSLRIPGVDAAKEWRVTVGASELPPEIWQVLKQSHEIHIRWSSPLPYEAISPLVSRTPPGLHVSFTPRKDGTQDNLCPLLTKIFGNDLACHSVKESFTAAPILSERFSMSAAYQYYQPLPGLQQMITYVQQKACAASNTICQDQVGQLSQATTLDFDFDAISHALKVTAVWARAPNGRAWDETVRLHSQSDTIEVGVLNAEKATEPEELSLGGFLTVVGEDSKPSATLFSFPSRHHPLPPSTPLTFSTSFLAPTGLHPTLQLSFPKTKALTPPGPSCALHAYLTLPSTVFIDRYQLSDPLFLASQNLVALRSLAGESDLEAPVWVLKKWGSASLFELKSPIDYYYDDSNDNGSGSGGEEGLGQWNISIPLHLRYLQPSGGGGANVTGTATAEKTMSGKTATQIPWPAVFWACEAEEGLKMSVNPFDRVNLGYDGLFGPKTMFYHVPPASSASGKSDAGVVGAGGGMYEKLEAPVLDLDKTEWVEVVTGIVVLIGFGWVGWMLLRGWTQGQKRVGVEKKKA